MIASAVAGLSTYYSSLTRPSALLESLPASYALCAEGRRIYTVDDSNLAVDCILVDKHSVAATGTLRNTPVTPPNSAPLRTARITTTG